MTRLQSDLLQKALSEKSLRHFIRNGWNAIESYQFDGNWHIDAICEHLQAVSDGQIRNLLINIPPRHMKSVGSSVFWPAWTWAQDPDPFDDRHGFKVRPGTWRGPGVRFLSASYAYALSVRDAGNSKRLMESDWYQEFWGDRFKIREDKSANDDFANNKNGARISISIDGGQVTGQGGDIIIVDDPHNVAVAESPVQREKVIRWWQESLPSRLNDQKRGAKILIMQRVNAADLTGHITSNEMGLDAVVDGPSSKTVHIVKWDHLCLPARFEAKHPTPVRSSLGFTDPRTFDGEPLWEARFDDEALKALEAPMTQFAIAGQLQQRPAPREGGMFKRAWFKDAVVPHAPQSIARVRRWDIAATDAAKGDPDWTVGVLMSQGVDRLYYIEDVIRFRGTPHVVENRIVQTAMTDGRNVPIRLPQDPGAAGKMSATYLIGKLAGFAARALPETGSKETRAEPFAAQCEALNVRLVDSPWIRAFLEELESFPNGIHDDQVDAAAGAFNALMTTYTGPLTGRYGYSRR